MTDQVDVARFVCDIGRCSKMASHFYTDLQEVDPVRVKDPSSGETVLWSQFTAVASHQRCDDHAEPQKRYYQDGTVGLSDGLYCPVRFDDPLAGDR